ncbi:MAG: NHLP leader peptide family RiPP precursor [Gemmatimonadaceae bacterium]
MAVSKERTRRHAHIVARAWEDDAYRARLLKNATKVLKEEGVKVPRGVRVKAVANSAKTVHFVIPAKPKKALTERQIAKHRMGPMETSA